MIMRNLLKRYPYIYLLLFCLLTLVAGIDVGDIINNGVPKEKPKNFIKILSIVINFVLAIFFFFSFVRIKNKQATKELENKK